MSGEKIGEHLGITFPAEDDAVPLEPLAKFTVVINLAIEADNHLTSCVRHRLGAGRGEIEDCQADMGEPRLRVMPFARAIWPAMPLGTVHLTQYGWVEASYVSCNATHGQGRGLASA